MGKMPLTLFVVTAATILWLYLRRAQVGSMKHPSEMRRPAPPQAKVSLKPKQGAPVYGGGLSPIKEGYIP